MSERSGPRYPLARGAPDTKLLLPSGLTSHRMAASVPANLASAAVPGMADIRTASGAAWPGAIGAQAFDIERGREAMRTAVGGGVAFATRIGRRVADQQDRQCFVRANRRVIAICAAGLVVVLGLGYWAACHQAARIADRRIRSVLAAAGLSGRVAYQSVSASPWGSVTLHHLAISQAEGETPTVTVASLSMRGLDSSGRIPPHLKVTATGIGCPLTRASRYCPALAGSPLLRALGYADVVGTVALDYRLTGDGIDLRSSGDLSSVGRWTVEASVPGVTRQAFDRLAAITQAPGELSLLGLMALAGEVGAARVGAVSLSLDDTELAHRLAQLPATAFPPEQTSSAPEATPALQRWRSQGGRIDIRADGSRPVPLTRPTFFSGLAINPTLMSLPLFVQASGASVELH